MSHENILFFQKYSLIKSLIEKKPFNWHLDASSALYFLLQDQLINKTKTDEKIIHTFPIDRQIQQTAQSNKILIKGIPSEFFNKKTIYSSGREELKMDKFLSFEMIEIESKKFKIKEIIHYFANNRGGRHLDTIPKKDIHKLCKEHPDYEKYFIHCIDIISKIVLIALKDLSEKCSPFPSYEHFLAHYDSYPNYLIFETEKFMECREMNSKIVQSFLYSAHMRFLNQKNDPAYFFHIKNFEKEIEFKCGIQKDRRLIGTLINGDKELTCMSRAKIDYDDFNISIGIFQNTKSLEMLIFYNNKLIGSQVLDKMKLNCSFDEMTFGADIEGKNGADFTVAETCIIVNGNMEKLQRDICKYFQIKYS